MSTQSTWDLGSSFDGEVIQGTIEGAREGLQRCPKLTKLKPPVSSLSSLLSLEKLYPLKHVGFGGMVTPETMVTLLSVLRHRPWNHARTLAKRSPF